MSEAERAGTPRQDTRQDNRDRLLAGRYRLGDVLGRGGMGTVWRAEDETLGRTVAVKELRFPGNIDEEEKRRLITRTLREAKAIARIRNNSAVTVFDVVQEDDRPWIVMELVEGKSLADVIREDGVLEPRRAAEVGLAVLDVLRSAHREGILHRDVKPSNVLIAEDGRVVLTDFGIAQVEGDPSITSTGMLVGAPSYISPERARGHKPGPAADLWSLGGLLYAAVEGVPPYDKGSAIATLTAVMTERLEEPKNAGPLKDVIQGLLTKDVAKRLDDAGARAMLNAVIHAPEPKESEPEPVLDATKVVPLPAQPDAPEDKGGSPGSGGKRGEEAGERLRGALRSVRQAAVAAGSAGPAAAARAKSGSGTAASGTGGAASGGLAETLGSGVPTPSAVSDSSVPASASASGGQGAKAGTGGRSSGWPVMPPPDLPPRPVPRAPLSDVVPRRTLVIIAVAVALAVIGTVLAFALQNGGDNDASGAGKGGKAVAGATPSADTKEDTGGGRPHTDGAKEPAATGSAPDSAPGAGADGSGDDGAGADDSAGKGDAATSRHQGNQGYSIGLPKGWKYRSTGAAEDRFTGPDGQKLLVGWTSTPKADPVADWRNQERYMVRSQYQRIRIEKVGFRGWNAADWEFTYVGSGTKYRTIDRGFVVNDHLGYALMYTAKAANWGSDLRKETWRTLARSFEPKS
ncbi:serine/threonine-protein kinase [Streptomyces sp. TRM68367]|uniref:serine/threonine-protein kinase n=1 Tax=Streptomyces sp. TRM68367 TaxID=2758415 RepID=UPI00165C2773|nr:serine/threonine-protein kinase [Streptomyces sp. TRM68367]MBC9725738.1 serine/threonine protein kinase [Streptomyces sp. TRM68367]